MMIHWAISCYLPRIFGVNIEQWRGSIGRFNTHKNSQRAPTVRCKSFLISTYLKKYLNFFKTHLFLAFSLFYSIILLFGFSCMAFTLTVLITLIRLGFAYVTFSDPVFSSEDISLTLYLVFSFPRFISSFTRTLVINPIKNNIAFQLLVLGMLLIIAGIESNPGPISKKNLSFAVWNLDSLPAHDYARIPLIESLQAEYKFDIFGVCESALTGSIPN